MRCQSLSRFIAWRALQIMVLGVLILILLLLNFLGVVAPLPRL
jgi:hypothetical protein